MFVSGFFLMEDQDDVTGLLQQRHMGNHAILN